MITQKRCYHGTPAQESSSQYKQGRLVEHFVAGTTARTAASLCEVNRKTSTLYFQRLREIIAYEQEAETSDMFGGEIEVPSQRMHAFACQVIGESYFGGRRKGKRGRGQDPCIRYIKKGWEGLHQNYPGRCFGDADPDY